MTSKSNERCLRALPAFRRLAATAVLGVLPFAANAAPPDAAGKSGIVGFVPGRVLVQPRAGLSDVDVDEIVKGHGGKRKGHFKQIDVHVVELPEQANTQAVAKALARHPHLKFAELDMIVAPSLLPNDPSYGSQWHLSKIRAADAWPYAVGDGITVAILDTGVDAAHPDLAPLMVPGWNFYSGNGDTSDVHGHGTKVAGAAAAAGNNGIGVSGVTWRARIMPIRIADPNAYATFSRMASGISYAADNGARIANISYSGASASLSVQSAANYMRSKGGVVVVSAENTGARLTYAQNASLTAVGATDGSDVKASFSSWGAYVDVAAPGVGILTTVRGGGYGAASGTSFSAPIVAGVYALMMSANRSLLPATLDSILQVTTTDLGAAGWDEYYGYGRINAAAAVQMAYNTNMTDTQAPSVAFLAPAAGKVAGTVAVDVRATDNVSVARVELYVNGALVATDASAPYAFAWNTLGMADGPATLQAKAFDSAGNVGTAGLSVTVANDAIAPTVTFTNPAQGATLSGTVYVTVAAVDDKVVTRTTLSINGKAVASVPGPLLTYAWSGGVERGRNKTAIAGAFTLTATAEDGAGNIGSRSLSVTRQ